MPYSPDDLAGALRPEQYDPPQSRRMQLRTLIDELWRSQLEDMYKWHTGSFPENKSLYEIEEVIEKSMPHLVSGTMGMTPFEDIRADFQDDVINPLSEYFEIMDYYKEPRADPYGFSQPLGREQIEELIKFRFGESLRPTSRYARAKIGGAQYADILREM